jgi:RND family efflux transporter MFP subunit
VGRRRIALVGGLFLLAAVGTVWRIAGREGDDLLFTVSRGRLDVTVEASGEVFAERSVSVTAPPVRWRLQVIWLVKEGTTVREGDLLVRFDPGELQKELSEKEAELRSLEAEIQQKRAQLAALENEYAMQLMGAQLDYDLARVQLVEDEGLVPRKELDQARLRLQNAGERLERTKSKLEAEREAAASQGRILEVRRKNAQSQYDFAVDSLKKMEIRAPSSGLVVVNEIWKGSEESKVQVGDSVWPGFAIIALPDFATLQVKVWASEVDAGILREGQPCTVSLDAFPDLSLPGKVRSVGQVGTKREYDAAKKEFEVVIGLDRLDERLKPGMTARASIVVATHSGVLSVPIESVRQEEGGAWVQVRERFGTRAAKVVLGDRNATHIIVKDGLADGDRILMLPPEKATRP